MDTLAEGWCYLTKDDKLNILDALYSENWDNLRVDAATLPFVRVVDAYRATRNLRNSLAVRTKLRAMAKDDTTTLEGIQRMGAQHDILPKS